MTAGAALAVVGAVFIVLSALDYQALQGDVALDAIGPTRRRGEAFQWVGIAAGAAGVVAAVAGLVWAAAGSSGPIAAIVPLDGGAALSFAGSWP